MPRHGSTLSHCDGGQGYLSQREAELKQGNACLHLGNEHRVLLRDTSSMPNHVEADVLIAAASTLILTVEQQVAEVARKKHSTQDRLVLYQRLDVALVRDTLIVVEILVAGHGDAPPPEHSGIHAVARLMQQPRIFPTMLK